MTFKEKIYIFFLFLTLAGFFIFSFPADAAGPYDYTQLEPIPGSSATTGADLKTYIESIYKFAIWTVGIAAILMITIGGFMYLTSAGNTSKMDVAKKVVTDAVIGLVIVLTAYLVLYVINPDLVKVTLSLKALKSGMSSTITGSESNSAIPSPSDSTGCSAIASAAKAMVSSGCLYSQAKRSDGCSTKPGYTDCSKFAGDAYVKAGCRRPGNVSGDFYSLGENVGSTSSLKSGDVLAVSGHVVVCENNGCSRVIHASGKDSVPQLKESNGSYYLNKSNVKVIRASRYCDSCKS